jgi:hypothetical protein
MEDIDRAVEGSLGGHERYEAAKDGRSRRRSYEKSIEVVREAAGRAEAGRLAEWIEERIRAEDSLPSGREVRKKGAEICREAGHSVSTNDWLGS